MWIDERTGSNSLKKHFNFMKKKKFFNRTEPLILILWKENHQKNIKIINEEINIRAQASRKSTSAHPYAWMLKDNTSIY